MYLSINKPFFSIIIPTLNEEKNLPPLLKCLENQTTHDFEVIVSDSVSTDNTQVQALSFEDSFPLNFYQLKTKNVSQARNNGASQARGDFLIFFDADVLIEDNFLSGVRERLVKYKLDSLTVWNRAKEPQLTGKIIMLLLNLSLSTFQKIKPGANGPCIIMRKTLFEKIHGFDDSIVFGEDFDLIQRATKFDMRFAVFQKPLLYVSTRRFAKEGFFTSLGKSFRAIFYQLFYGPIRKPIFDYEMGGQYYK